MGYSFIPVTIQSGQSVSNSGYTDIGEIAGVAVPGNWTAAKISWQASVDNGNEFVFSVVKDNTGAEISYGNGTDTSALYMTFSTLNLPGVVWFKIQSGTSTTPVTQAALRTVYVVVRV